MNKSYYVIGLIIGLIVGLLIAAVIIKLCNKGEKGKPEYDERQYIARLKSFKAGFLTMALSIVIMVVLAIVGADFPLDPAVKYFIPFFFGVIGMVSSGIWTDGYWGMNTDKKRFIIIISVVTVINLAIPIIAWTTGSFINEEGLIGVPMIEFLIGIMCVILLIQLVIKEYIDHKIDERISGEDDE